MDSILPGGSGVVITGAGFGTTAGRVLLGKLPVTVLSWADTRIEGRVEPGVLGRSVTIDLWRPGNGWFTETWEAP